MEHRLCIARWLGEVRPAWAVGAALVLGAVGARCETTLSTAAPASTGVLTARAAIDFRITIQPSIALRLADAAPEGENLVVDTRRRSRRGSVPQLHVRDSGSTAGTVRWTLTEP